jgi:hypothetical protein
MSANHRWAGEAYALIRKLVAEQGLILYKPQSHLVHVSSWQRRIWRWVRQKMKPWHNPMLAGALLIFVGALVFVVLRFLWSLTGLRMR